VLTCLTSASRLHPVRTATFPESTSLMDIRGEEPTLVNVALKETAAHFPLRG
jgi:hypothetical protein